MSEQAYQALQKAFENSRQKALVTLPEGDHPAPTDGIACGAVVNSPIGVVFCTKVYKHEGNNHVAHDVSYLVIYRWTAE